MALGLKRTRGVQAYGAVTRHRYRSKTRTTRIAQAAALVVALIATLVPYVGLAAADEVTASQDVLRTGWDPAEPTLSPAAVASSNFGQLFATKVTGQVYAQPLVIGNTLVVSTEDDWVYGLDSATGVIKWSRNLGPTWPSATIGCADLAPNIGNTSTGTYDPATDTVYLTTKVNDGPDTLSPNWYLHAITVSTGVEKAGWPAKITGTPSNDPVHPFIGKDVNQRPSLLLMNGVVYMAFGSQCDYGTYVGWVVGVNTTNRSMNVWSDEAGSSSSEAGIWQGGGGIVSDGPGRLFVSTGNGITAPDGPGSSPPLQLSQSVIRLGVGPDGVISAQDFFSPANAATLDLNDQDLGSGGPVGLPSQYFGTSALPNLMVEIGKDGRLFLLNRDRLGGKAQGSGRTDDVVQTLGPYLGVWGHPAVYGGEGGYVYLVQARGSMLAFKYGVDGAGKPALSLAGNSAEIFGYTSGSPAITSDATTPGSAVVWAVNVDNTTGANGRLCAYNGVPTNGNITLLRCFPIGTGSKFATPATANGRVFVGTRDGYVYGFGQPAAAALNAPQTTFGNVSVSSTGHATVVATAVRAVTVTGITTSAPFSVTVPTLPVTLAAGQTISVDAAFTPTTPGSFTGGLTFALTDGATAAVYGAALQGNAIRPGFTATPATIDFGAVSVGAVKSLTASFSNTGTTNETVTAFTGPGSPFTVSGAPTVGTVLSPGQSLAVSITYAPTAVARDTATVTLTGPSGTASVSLVASGVAGQGQLTIAPTGLDFGKVLVGSSSAQTLTVTNTGTLAVTVTKAAPPALPFVVTTPLPEGLVLGPGDTVSVAVAFAPSVAGSVSGLYTISSDDGQGAHQVAVTGTGVNPSGGAPLPSAYGGGWVLNGSAAMAGANLSLTTATANQVGAAVFSAPLPSSGLKASFTAQLNGGTGGDGLTFSLLSATGATPKSIGTGGAGLGVLGLPGIAVTLDTAATGNDPSANFIGLSTGSANGVLTYAATATNVPNLRVGTHAVVVTVSGATVAVQVDGVQRLSATVAVPASVFPAFTASTGTLTDAHVLSAISVSSGTTALPAPGTGWRYNGVATTSSGEVIVTPAQKNVTGSVLYSTPIQTDGMRSTFTLTTNGGTGADGATFALLDPAQQTAASLGSGGAGLGFGGLAGVSIAFCTYPQNGIDSHNFVSVLTSTKGGGASLVAANTAVPNLRSTNRTVAIGVSGKTVTVSIDGTQVLTAQVPTITPTAVVGFTAATGGLTDVHRVTNVQVQAGPSTLLAPPDSGWAANGSTTINAGKIQLTPAAKSKVGTAFYRTAVPTTRLDATFTIQIGGGTGADGMTFALLDATTAVPTGIGLGGGGLGVAGLPGVAVAFDTYRNPVDPSANFVGIATTNTSGVLTYLATTTNVPNLRTGTHQVEVVVGTAGNLIVKVDATLVLDTVVAVPASALVGFTASTGGSYDLHAASAITVLY